MTVKNITKTKKPCPGSKIRSKGLGRGLGFGGGNGPVNRMNNLGRRRYALQNNKKKK